MAAILDCTCAAGRVNGIFVGKEPGARRADERSAGGRLGPSFRLITCLFSVGYEYLAECYNVGVGAAVPYEVKTLMTTRKFWPLDFDPEGEVYENVAWDLPGYNRASARAEDSIHPFERRRHRAQANRRA